VTVEELEPFIKLVDYVGGVPGFPFVETVTTIVNSIGDYPVVIREGATSIADLQTVYPEIGINKELIIS